MSYKKTLSVVIITINEAELLQDCLDSVNWADEIVVLDAGSIDDTCYIASQAGARVFQTTDWLGFGIQRQRAQSYACKDYILMLDADERVTPTLRKEIQNVLKHPVHTMVYSCARRNLFLGKFMKYGGWYPDRVIRIYERDYYQYNTLSVHESLIVEKFKVINLNGELQHLTCRDLSSFQHKQLKYAESWALDKYYKGYKCNLFAIISYASSSFFKTLLLYASFLDGKRGWLLALVKAQYTFNKYAILWALTHTMKGK